MEKLITYVGLDVHKETISVAFAQGGDRGDACYIGKIANSAGALSKLARKLSQEGRRRCCQAKANQSPKHPKLRRSGRQLTPLGQGSGAVLLEDFAAVEMAVVVEMVMDRGVGGSEFLQRFDVPKLGHRSLSSSERLV